MASVALVDSNVFISLLRQGTDPMHWLRENLEDVYTCGMVRLEVLRGIKEPRSLATISGFFDVFCDVPTDNKTWEFATELAWTLDRRGITLPAQDILIASCAGRAGVPVLTADLHFHEIPGIHVIPFVPL